jgi:hypothetical protein
MTMIDGNLQNQGTSTRFVRYLWEELEGESWLNTPGWKLVSRELIPETRSATMDAQHSVMQALPTQEQFFFATHQSPRNPTDIVFDCALARANGVVHLTSNP